MYETDLPTIRPHALRSPISFFKVTAGSPSSVSVSGTDATLHRAPLLLIFTQTAATLCLSVDVESLRNFILPPQT